MASGQPIASSIGMRTRFLLFIAGAVVAMAQSSSALVTPSGIPDYEAITAHGRGHWVVSNIIGPANLAAGAFTAGLATRSNSPEEYGPHWDGFAKRYGMRMTGRATSSLMEASLGSLWGEDPRYFRTSGQPLMSRLDNVFRMTFIAHDRAGNEMPAYARYIAIPASTVITNAWRPDSQTQLRDVVGRISFSLMSHVIANAFAEFGPDLKKRLSRNKDLSIGAGK